MKDENHEYSNKIISSLRKDNNDLQLSNERLTTKLKTSEKLAETRLLLVESLRKGITNAEQWSKILCVILVVFLAFIIYMFRCYSKQRAEIEALKSEFVTDTVATVVQEHDSVIFTFNK